MVKTDICWQTAAWNSLPDPYLPDRAKICAVTRVQQQRSTRTLWLCPEKLSGGLRGADQARLELVVRQKAPVRRLLQPTEHTCKIWPISSCRSNNRPLAVRARWKGKITRNVKRALESVPLVHVVGRRLSGQQTHSRAKETKHGNPAAQTTKYHRSEDPNRRNSQCCGQGHIDLQNQHNPHQPTKVRRQTHLVTYGTLFSLPT